MAKAFVVFTAGCLLLTMSMPGEAGAPLDRVESAVAEVIQIVTGPDLQGRGHRAERRARLRDVADDLFDFPEMANRALGRHWQTPSEADRAQFLALFTDLLERCYFVTIDNYAGERIVFLGETVRDGYATVRTKIVTTRGAEIPVDYRLRASTARWLVYDVSLDGISLTANYREQINRVLRTNSFAALLDRMRAGEFSAIIVPPGAGKPR
jgi:phospholipid transport system substrate-binding protein